MVVTGNNFTEAAAVGLSAPSEGKHLQVLNALQTLKVLLTWISYLMTHTFCMEKVSSWPYLKHKYPVNQATLDKLLLRVT